MQSQKEAAVAVGPVVVEEAKEAAEAAAEAAKKAAHMMEINLHEAFEYFDQVAIQPPAGEGLIRLPQST